MKPLYEKKNKKDCTLPFPGLTRAPAPFASDAISLKTNISIQCGKKQMRSITCLGFANTEAEMSLVFSILSTRNRSLKTVRTRVELSQC